MLDARQGARARGLRVRGGRRLAGAADPARAARGAAAVSRRRVSRVDALGRREPSVCEATVKVRVGNEHAHTVADGDGPVNALDGALRAALVTFYPHLADRPPDRLQGPHRRFDDRHRGAHARADRVERRRVRAGRTIGVNENIIEASLQALVDSLEYGLLKKEFAAGVV